MPLQTMRERLVPIAAFCTLLAMAGPTSSPACAQGMDTTEAAEALWLPEPIVVTATAGKAVSRAFDAKSAVTFADQAVYSINLSRADAGLPPLKRTAALDAAAVSHSTRMGEYDYLSHCDLLQQTWPIHRLASQGFSALAAGVACEAWAHGIGKSGC